MNTMIGQTVSHYRIVEHIGEGGMGVVYKAQDTKLDRFVALKFLPKELSTDERTRKRFVHEAKSASSLDHPNICTIHEIDETNDGQTFIVMPFYEGESLAQKIKAGPMAILDALEIIIQIAAGLARAHDKGILHRDVKPANILVTIDGQVKLVDFGVAKLAGQTTLTKTGMRVGTAGYMSPEQAVGKPLDAGADVFALGVVLYELVTGHLPFRGDVEAAVLYSIVHEDHIPLANRRDNMPEDLEEIVSRALQKEVEDRYASAAEMIFDLDVLRRQLTDAQPLRIAKPRRKRSFRLPAAGWAIVVALAVAVGVIALKSVWQPLLLSTGDTHALAIVDFRGVAEDDPVDAAGLTHLVDAGLLELSPVRVVSAEYLYDLRRRVFGDAEGPIGAGEALEIARQAKATMVVTGQMGTAGAIPFVTWKLVDVRTGNSLGGGSVDGQELRLLADKIIAEVLPLVARESETEAPLAPASVAQYTTSSADAHRHYVNGMLARRQFLLTVASDELKRAVELDSTFALAHFELSRSYDMELERNLIRHYSDRAWTFRANLGVKDRMRLEAWRHRVSSNPGAAIATYEEMLVRWPDDRAVLTDLTNIFYYNWLYSDAAAVAAKGLVLYPDNIELAGSYAASLTYTGRLRESVDATRAVTQLEPSNHDAWDELGLCYLSAGQADSADIAFRKALSIEPDYVWSRAGLGYSEYVRGNIDTATEKFEQLLASGIPAATDSVELLTEVTFWPGLALLYAEQGRFDKALDLFELIPMDPTETQIEGRIQLLLRMDRPRDAVPMIEMLSATTEDPFHGPLAEHYMARAMVAIDSLDAARELLDRLEKDLEAGENRVPFMALRVAATVALAEGDHEAALSAVDEMQRQGLPPGGLHDIERRESRAQALAMAGRLEESAAELEALLGVYGSHVVARYQLGQVYEELGRRDEAESEYHKFLAAWSGADKEMPQLADAQARLDVLAASAQ